MKINALLFILLSLPFVSFSQNDSLSAESEYQGNTLLKGLTIDIGTAYISSPDAFGVPEMFNVKTGRPSTVNIYFFKPIKLFKKYFSFLPGIGLAFDNYYFEKDLQISPVGDSLFYWDEAGVKNIKRSKLSATYIDIPLELQFASKANYKKAFKFAIGGKFGVLLSGKSKLNYVLQGEDVKVKSSDKSLNKIRYGLTGRVGYGVFNLFAYYSLSSIFKDQYAPETTPIIFGISVTSF